ncbi:MAG: carbohydrate binding domain-containing protein, partial [Candidatus Promineifilaceae bacterium]
MSRVLRITDAASRRVSNPIFDDWTSGVPTNWVSTGTPTLAQIVSEGTVQSYASAYAVDVLNGSTQAVRGIYQDITDLVEGQTYYVSVYVRPVVGTVRLYAWDGGGTSNAEFVESTAVTGEWQQLIVKKVATSGGIRIGLIAFNASSRAVFDLVQIATFNIEFIEGVYDTHFRVTNWDIAVPDYKGGGVFSSSPVAEGQKLIDGYWDNVSQTISFHLRGDTDQNEAANKLGELFQALQAARDFSKTSWVRDPVYMQFKAENETNYRYAFIANA